MKWPFTRVKESTFLEQFLNTFIVGVCHEGYLTFNINLF